MGWITSLIHKNDKNGVSKKLRPIELHQTIGRHLVVDLKLEPDWVWQLKYVHKPDEAGNPTSRVRLFDPKAAMAKNIQISRYADLDQHPDLILFEGIFDKPNMTFQMIHKLKKAS